MTISRSLEDPFLSQQVIQYRHTCQNNEERDNFTKTQKPQKMKTQNFLMFR